jgi:hypothetical protein
MAAIQTILCTVIPRGVSLNAETLPVSIFFAPRLIDDQLPPNAQTRLGEFPDWLNWTEQRQSQGLRVTFECNGQTLTSEISAAARQQLRPDLWRELFNTETLVRSHQIDNYENRFISSYPVREALSSLKRIYQTAGVALALPQAQFGPADERQFPKREFLKGLVNDFQIYWGDRNREDWRSQQLNFQRDVVVLSDEENRYVVRALSANTSQLGPDGLYQPNQSSYAQKTAVERFGVFSNMPVGEPIRDGDFDSQTVLDFHQVISSLNTYFTLQRSLGLVFDLELPREFVPIQAEHVSLRVVGVESDWQLQPTVVGNKTACIHRPFVENGDRYFCAAPQALVAQDASPSVFGLLQLNADHYGLAQVDVDGGMHKTVILAENLHQDSNPLPAQHPEVFDTTTTLASLRSGGISLYADNRALHLLKTLAQSKKFNDDFGTANSAPFFAEDLVRGYRIDVWDALTEQWHSLHRRNGVYQIGAQVVTTTDEEGFMQLAATQAAPKADGTRDHDDLYLHEAIARWSGWSLSADTPGKHMTSSADPEKAVPDPNEPIPENEAVTPFPMTTQYSVLPGSLPRLRFGGRYRFRARAVDLAGNSLGLNDPVTAQLTPAMSLPAGEQVFPYLRFEPVAAPVMVLRDERGVTGKGSSLDRMVIRSFNSDPTLDDIAAETLANDRHIAPPRGSVEFGERHGMFDDATGKLDASAAMWQLICQRDEGQFTSVEVPSIVINGEIQAYPIESSDRISLPYLPDPLARGAAFRNLPGTLSGTIGRAAETGAVPHQPLEDANPRPGSATLISFGGQDWQESAPFRFILEAGDGPPLWDSEARSLTVYLPKGQTHVTPLSCYTSEQDLPVMGVWQWLQEYIEYITTQAPKSEFDRVFAEQDHIAHILQSVVEGGHWMLTPPHLVTLVHAVQQPLGVPQFTRINALLSPDYKSDLQSHSESSPTAETELDTVTAWRTLGSTDAYLMGGLQIHGASTAKVDLRAEWRDPIDDIHVETITGQETQQFSAFVEEIPLASLTAGTLYSSASRPVSYYDPEHDLLCFARRGSQFGNLDSGEAVYEDVAPRHQIGDTRHHVVHYRAIATSRYREYFPQLQDDGVTALDFTRKSDAVTVHIPASTRPLAPQVLYVVPTFGWQRETSTNIKRSVRMGGGLRVYLDRPWWSSGEGELLGVALDYTGGYGFTNEKREDWKPFITQWGEDPIWHSERLEPMPSTANFPDAVIVDRSLPLEATVTNSQNEQVPRIVDIAAHKVEFDRDRQLWYCDLTVDTNTTTYAPFVRLALVRYQPYALQSVKVSRVVLSDFAQLTPERAATLTADPYQRGQLRLTISGAAANRWADDAIQSSDLVVVTLQEQDATLESDLAWREVRAIQPGKLSTLNGLMVWTSQFSLADLPSSNRYRLLIREYELLPSDRINSSIVRDRRLIYSETVLLDEVLLTNSAPRFRGL